MVDADLWLCALDLAAMRGWRPLGVVPPPGAGDADGRLRYFRPEGQSVTEDDARELARCLETALPGVPDEVMELHDLSFGDDHTMELLRGAADGRRPEAGAARGAVEILSGPPKSQARHLIDFLRGGTFTIQSTPSPAGAQHHG